MSGVAVPAVADVVVIGSGSAGAVVARRLADAGVDVVLLEAGEPDANPAIHEPARLFELWDSEQDWGYRTVPQAACAGRELHWPRGKVLGGSSALNGMIYVRGHRSDYDSWAAAGNEGWSYDDVLPLFKRSEDFDRGASAYHGVGGPQHVLSRYAQHPVLAAVVAAAQEAGIVLNDDYNGEHLDGVSFAQLNIKDGRRQTAATAFLAPLSATAGLTVVTGAHARRLLFEGGRCVGVELSHEGAVAHIRAEREVVVSGGTIESAKLLLLSGIGPADELRRLGIDVVVDLPGVGKNLHDHLLSPVIYSAAQTVPAALPGLQQLHGHLFWRSRPGLPAPDAQPLFFHLPMYLEGMEGPPDGYTLMAGIIRPESRGALRLASADPDQPPLLDPACLSSEVDASALVAAIELCREIGDQDSLDEWRGSELYPGRDVRSPAGIRDYARQTAITYHHQAGTCKMGVDELAVVDPQLRVHGVEGLRVADASVMPQVTSGNTHAPTVMIGERAADLVRAAL
jgi:choline dehydrogenase